jgi:hypothetical protein
MSRWFRFHAAALDNPKIQKLKPDLFKAWVNMLCVAAKRGGTIPPVDDLAFLLRVDEDRAEAIVAELVERRLLEQTDDGYRPHDWSQHQYESDTSTGRVQRYRERQRNGDCNVSSAVSETPPDTDTDTDTDTETERTSPPSTEPRAQESEGGRGIDFEEFQKGFPHHDGIAWHPAMQVWVGLNLSDQRAALDALPAFTAGQRAKPPTRPMSPRTYLAERRWTGFAPKVVTSVHIPQFKTEAERDAWWLQRRMGAVA